MDSSCDSKIFVFELPWGYSNLEISFDHLIFRDKTNLLINKKRAFSRTVKIIFFLNIR